MTNQQPVVQGTSPSSPRFPSGWAVAGILCFLALLMGSFTELLGAQENAKTSAFMRLKLDHAQNVLEGIAVEDYAKISKNAQAMVLLSHESNWKVLQTPDYIRHSEDFRRIAHAMVKHSKEKNVDAVAIDYVLLTTNCVQCHKYVREKQAK